jgi:multisite-specific tRNA:(cytosine-C5)-methyltransferase
LLLEISTGPDLLRDPCFFLSQTIIQNNDYTRLRLVSAGVKLFSRQSNTSEEPGQCQWRACAEGLSVLLNYISPEDVVKVSLKELKVLLEVYYPLIKHFEEPVRSLFESVPIGSMVCAVQPGELDGGRSVLFLRHSLA